jgi:hypothetical protein
MTTDITEDEFILRFRPERDQDGSLFVQRYDSTDAERSVLERCHAERRLWTYVNDGAGNAAPVQGYYKVNREFYIVCAEPYEGDEDITVHGDMEHCTLCGERFADEADPEDPDVVTRSTGDLSICVDCAAEGEA